jgi:hypothetical protein
MKETMTRRQMLKLGGAALLAIPVLGVVGNAQAAQNAAVRTAMKYQGKPGPEGKKCSTCLQFVAPTGCKIIPGDNEIAAEGYCVGWTKK